MWFNVAVVAVTVSPQQKKAAHVFLKRPFNQRREGAADDGPAGSAAAADDFTVSDASLAAFCFPLGAESQTPKDRMAPEVGPIDQIHVLSAMSSAHSTTLMMTSTKQNINQPHTDDDKHQTKHQPTPH
jgi:hypothetical protein